MQQLLENETFITNCDRAIVLILHVGFPPYCETKQFVNDIQQQNHSLMECQYFEKHSRFADSIHFFCV